MADDAGGRQPGSIAPEPVLAARPAHLVQADRGPATLALDEPVGRGIQRICVARLDRAITGLTDDEDRDAGVHTARKSMKRIRAMLRLVRDEIGYRVYRDENVVLRDTSRRIAPVRDSVVLVETLDAVGSRYGLEAEAFADLRANLARRHEVIAGQILSDRQLLADVTTTLRVSRARFVSWPLEAPAATSLRIPISDGFEAVAGGLHRVYGRGRARMRDAYAERTTLAFHEWRKRVKYLRYQMEVLAPLWPEVVGGYARSLERLGESLGLEHDLAVLEETVAADPRLCPDREARRLLGAVILHERAVIRQGARAAGMLAFAEAPEAFVRRLDAYWEAARGR
jgi:CHAD domain-containing protein